ncbi:S41 family peptidase [Marinagarivorans algicola]|uniref:S41 family peptidase n=1 Tax=Marinagarivorans algicola TaxID=1513270 RepID=UPI0037371107
MKSLIRSLIKQVTITTSIALALLMMGCNNVASFDRAVQGYWQSNRYGWVMVVEERGISLYDQLKGECLRSDIFPLFVDIEALPHEFVLDNGDLMTALNGIKSPPIRWQRRASLAQACPKGEIARSGAADYQENVLRDYDWYVATFERHYAFSALRNIDTETLFKGGRAQLQASPTVATLQSVLEAFIAITQDGHVKLFALDLEQGGVDELANGDIAATLEGALGLEGHRNGVSDLDTYVSAQVDIILNSIRQHLDMSRRKADSGGIMHWIPVAGQNQGYVLLEGMENFGGEALTLDAQSIALESALDELVADFKNVDRIIIDNRLNGGGFDRFGFQIAQRFMASNTTQLNKQVYVGGDWLAAETLNIKRNAVAYSGDVILLNSPYTASAAETFSIVMAEQANVRIMGERTAGELSDMLFKVLPSGLVFSLSNEAYKNEAGELFEFIGVPVDIQAKSFTNTQRLNGQDNTLADAIALP